MRAQREGDNSGGAAVLYFFFVVPNTKIQLHFLGLIQNLGEILKTLKKKRVLLQKSFFSEGSSAGVNWGGKRGPTPVLPSDQDIRFVSVRGVRVFISGVFFHDDCVLPQPSSPDHVLYFLVIHGEVRINFAFPREGERLWVRLEFDFPAEEFASYVRFPAVELLLKLFHLLLHLLQFLL